MKLDIVEFYPLEENAEKDVFNGTIRLSLGDIDIDLLGIYVYRKKGKWMFVLPGRKSLNVETKCYVWYHFFSFTDHKKNKEMTKVLMQKLPKFMDQWIKNRDNPSPVLVHADIKIPLIEKIASKEWASPPLLKIRKRNDLRNNILAK